MTVERRSGDEEARRAARYRRLEISQLVERLRAGDYFALVEFVSRHRGLLMSHAERFGFAVDDARALATEVLHDVVLELVEHPSVLPRSMDAWVVRSFRNRALNAVRDASRRGGTIPTDPGSVPPSIPDTSGPAGTSQAMLRAAAGPDWEPVALSPALERLSVMLDQSLSQEERQLLAWVSEYVPQSEIAAWLGISHSAARKQLERLRQRLAAAARAHAEAVPRRERVVLLQFFRRLDVMIDDRRALGDRRVSGDA